MRTEELSVKKAVKITEIMNKTQYAKSRFANQIKVNDSPCRRILLFLKQNEQNSKTYTGIPFKL